MNNLDIASFVHTIYDAIEDISETGLSELELALLILRDGKGKIEIKDGSIVELTRAEEVVFTRPYLPEQFFKLELYLSVAIAFKIGNFYFGKKGIHVYLKNIVEGRYTASGASIGLLDLNSN